MRTLFSPAKSLAVAMVALASFPVSAASEAAAIDHAALHDRVAREIYAVIDHAPAGEDRSGILARGAAALVELRRCDEAVALLTRETEVRGGLIEEAVNKAWRNLPFNDGLEDKACMARLAPLMADRFDDPIYNAIGQQTVRLRAGAYLEAAGKAERGRQEIEAAEQALLSLQGSRRSLWEARYQMLGIYRDTPLFAPALERYSKGLAKDGWLAKEQVVRGWVRLLVRQGRRDLAEPIIEAASRYRMSYEREYIELLVDEKRWGDVAAFLESPNAAERIEAAAALSKGSPAHLLPHLDIARAEWGSDMENQHRLVVIFAGGLAKAGHLEEARTLMDRAVNALDALPRPANVNELKTILRHWSGMGEMDRAWALAQRYQGPYMHEFLSALAEGAALAGRWDEVERSLGEIREPWRQRQAYGNIAAMRDEVAPQIRINAFKAFAEGGKSGELDSSGAHHQTETARMLATEGADFAEILSVAAYPAAKPEQRFDALVNAMDVARCAGREDVARQLAVYVWETARTVDFSSILFDIGKARALLKAGLADIALRVALAEERPIGKLRRLEDIAHVLRLDSNSCGMRFRF